MASSMSDHLANASAVFKLTFAAGTELHGATNAFISSNTTDYPAANNLTLAHVMTGYWVSFVVAHDPNVLRVEGAPFWGSYVGSAPGSQAEGEGVGFNVLAVTYTVCSLLQSCVFCGGDRRGGGGGGLLFFSHMRLRSCVPPYPALYTSHRRGGRKRKCNHSSPRN